VPVPHLDLEVHLEPIVRIADEATVAEELLLRPVDGGSLLARVADEGVDMAWVTRTAMAAAGRVLARRRVPLHVNITAEDRHDPRFVAVVEAAVAPAGLAHLVFEVTEHSEVVPSPRVRRTLVALRRRGVRFAIDDYGDGWAGPASADVVRPEVLKVRLPSLRDRAGGAVLLCSLLAAAAAHHAQVVVEEIETEADLRAARRLGFPHAQGWYWSPAGSTALR
jgi:EAL domain-containing protein (putative c-di-GMP-specific phosphodiesterase class I)